MKNSTNLDPDCICGQSSRCLVHNPDSSKKACAVNVVFNVCKQHQNGLELDNVLGCIGEATFKASPNICAVGACTRKGYAAYGLTISGNYIPE